MPYHIDPTQDFGNTPTFNKLIRPLNDILHGIPELESRGNRPLQMDFEHQLKALIFYHLEEHSSGRHLLQVLEEDDFAKNNIAPPNGIKKSSFFEALNTRGLNHLQLVFDMLQNTAVNLLPSDYGNLGSLVAIDGSLIDAVLSMTWADYRQGSKKAKIHFGLDLNAGIPQKIYLTDGKSDERPFVSDILLPGQTGVLDRGYQKHALFDKWEDEGKFFVCRIKSKTDREVLEMYKTDADNDGTVFFDAKVKLGTEGVNQTRHAIRLIGYKIGNTDYWVATNRFDLEAAQIAFIYKLRWDVEKFFKWWKRHLKVYHIIARTEYGLLVQILTGLITYLLLSIYCHNNYGEKVSIRRVREIRIRIQNESRKIYHLPQKVIVKDHKRCQEIPDVIRIQKHEL